MTVPQPHTDEQVTVLPCRGRCRVHPTQRHHHDRLLAVESDLGELLELFELALTWGELDYSDAGCVPPEQWPDFAAGHDWRDPDRAARIFSVATDIARASMRRDGAGRDTEVVSALLVTVAS